MFTNNEGFRYFSVNNVVIVIVILTYHKIQHYCMVSFFNRDWFTQILKTVISIRCNWWLYGSEQPSYCILSVVYRHIVHLYRIGNYILRY